MKRPSDSGLDSLPVHERIRRRREQLGLTAGEVAKRAGISASYISLIETGAKVPHARVALRLAKALHDDPDLYLAWAHASRHDDLTIFDRMRPWIQASSSDDPNFARHVASGHKLHREDYEEAPQTHAPRRSVARDDARDDAEESNDEPAGVTLVEIPVLRDGADPGDDPLTSDAVLETLRMDRRALPPGPIERPFAYRPGPAAVRRVRSRIHPGDLVVLTSAMGKLTPDRVHALRHDGRIVLTRVLFKKRALLMLPPEGADEFDVVQVGGRDELRQLIAGTVILTTRAWSAVEPETPHRPRLSKSSKLKRLLWGKQEPDRGEEELADRAKLLDDEGSRMIVRDCHWKEKYGWRPIQRPEDLETLDANPGMRIRFRLIKDERVRYHLEMDAHEWRDALGHYGDTPGWRRNGTITPVTRMRDGEYTLEFKSRWAAYVRES